VETCQGSAADVRSVAFSADGTRVASGGADNQVRVWDVASGRQLQAFASGGAVHSVQFLPDNRSLLFAGADKTVRVASVALVRLIAAHKGAVHAIVPLPNAPQLFSAGADNAIQQWDLSTGNQVRTLGGHAGPVLALALSGDGQKLVSGSADK